MNPRIAQDPCKLSHIWESLNSLRLKALEEEHATSPRISKGRIVCTVDNGVQAWVRPYIGFSTLWIARPTPVDLLWGYVHERLPVREHVEAVLSGISSI